MRQPHSKVNAERLSAALNFFFIGSSGRVKIWRDFLVGVRVGELTRVLRVYSVHAFPKLPVVNSEFQHLDGDSFHLKLD